MAAFALLAIGTSVAASALAGGEAHQIEIRVPAGQLRLLLVEQRGIDLLVTCREGAVANAPTGRLGYEAVLLEQDSRCQLSPKMAQAVRGMYRAEVLNPADAPLGMDTAGWRLYAGLLLLDDQVQGARQAAIAGFKELLGRNTLDQSFRLHLELAIGNLLRRTRDSQAALEHYQRARQLATRGALRTWLPTIDIAAGLAQLDAQAFALAIGDFERAAALAKKQGNAYEHAAASNNVCLTQHHLGKLEQAADCYLQAVRLYRLAGEVEQLATPLYNWSTIAQARGDPIAALGALEEVRAIREMGPYDRSLGNAYLQIGVLSARMADWRKALEYTLKASEVFDRLAAPADRARALRARAMVLRRLGLRQRALSAANTALDAARQQSDPQVHGGVWAELALLAEDPELKLQAHEQAARHYQQAEQHEQSHQQELLAILALVDLGQLDAAARRLKAVTAQAGRQRSSTEALLARAQAHLHAASEDLPAAFQLARQTLSLSLRLRDADAIKLDALTAFDVSMTLGEVASARSFLDTALTAHRQSRQSLTSMQQLQSSADRELVRGLLRWHSHAAVSPTQLWHDLDQLGTTPEVGTSHAAAEDWSRYQFLVAQLQDTSKGERSTALEREIEALESKLELSFELTERGQSLSLSEATALLDDGSRVLRVLALEGKGKILELCPSGVRIHLLELVQDTGKHGDLCAVGEGPSPPRDLWQLGEIRDRRSAEAFAAWRQRSATHRIGIALLSVDRKGLERSLPISSSAHLAFFADSQSGPLLPGVERERQWLSHHYGSRFMEVQVEGPRIHVPAAEILHVSTHGSLSDRHAYASVVSSQTASKDGEALGYTTYQFEFQGKPKLIIVNACNTLGDEDLASVQTFAAELARNTGATIIATARQIDDRESLRFARALHSALATSSPESALHDLDQQGSVKGEKFPWQVLR